MKKLLEDVSKWNSVAGNIKPSKRETVNWMRSQLPHYQSEYEEFSTAKTDQENIDGIVDVVWTSLNLFYGNEHKLEQAINTEVGVSMKPFTEQIERKINQNKSFVALKLATRQIQKMQSFCEVQGWDFNKAWNICSKSNWAKFATKESDAEASQKYYQDKLGVKTKYAKVGKYYVLRVDGEQVVNGKRYSDNKIMKCGRVFKGAYVAWIEPDWSEALSVGVE